MGKILNDIIAESFKTISKLTNDPDLLAIVGSWRDSLTDDEVLGFLRDWNNYGTIWKRKIIEVQPNSRMNTDKKNGYQN